MLLRFVVKRLGNTKTANIKCGDDDEMCHYQRRITQKSVLYCVLARRRPIRRYQALKVYHDVFGIPSVNYTNSVHCAYVYLKL